MLPPKPRVAVVLVVAAAGVPRTVPKEKPPELVTGALYIYMPSLNIKIITVKAKHVITLYFSRATLNSIWGKKTRPNSFVKIDGAQQVSNSKPAEDHAIDSLIHITCLRFQMTIPHQRWWNQEFLIQS